MQSNQNKFLLTKSSDYLYPFLSVSTVYKDNKSLENSLIDSIYFLNLKKSFSDE